VRLCQRLVREHRLGIGVDNSHNAAPAQSFFNGCSANATGLEGEVR
jgi:hypothetical protein